MQHRSRTQTKNPTCPRSAPFLLLPLLSAHEPDEGGAVLGELLSRLVKSGLEDQLHSRLRENLEGGGAAMRRRLKAASEAGTLAAPAALPAAQTATAGGVLAPAAPQSIANAAAAGSLASLAWLTSAHALMRSQLLAERLELLHCLLLLYEVWRAGGGAGNWAWGVGWREFAGVGSCFAVGRGFQAGAGAAEKALTVMCSTRALQSGLAR